MTYSFCFVCGRSKTQCSSSITLCCSSTCFSFSILKALLCINYNRKKPLVHLLLLVTKSIPLNLMKWTNRPQNHDTIVMYSWNIVGVDVKHKLNGRQLQEIDVIPEHSKTDGHRANCLYNCSFSLATLFSQMKMSK